MSGSPRVLQAGVARVIITPQVGIRMMGYTVQESVSESVEDDLTATCLVLSDGNSRVAILACDLLFVQSPHAESCCQRIADRLGISPSQVLVNCSHTHLAPMFPGWQHETPSQGRLQADYLETLQKQLEDVAETASHNMQPARLGVAKGSALLGINRREKLDDGRVVIGENPTGAIDREVGVIRIDDLAGHTLATLMIASCHPVVLGPKSTCLSPDFVGPARRIVESVTRAPSLFLQGAAANINPVCGIGTGDPVQFSDSERLGTTLAGEVIKLWSGIRTDLRHGPRRIVQSVAAISTWSYEACEEATIQSFGLATRQLTLPMDSLPDLEFARRQAAEKRRILDELRARQATVGELHVAQRLVEWSELVQETVEQGRPVTRDLKVWALRINDLGIIAVNGEPFAELSLQIKRESALPMTFLLGYSNGCLGYLPTPEAFAEGGMEVVESYRNYLLPCGFTREWGPTVVKTALELLAELARTA